MKIDRQLINTMISMKWLLGYGVTPYPIYPSMKIVVNLSSFFNFHIFEIFHLDSNIIGDEGLPSKLV